MIQQKRKFLPVVTSLALAVGSAQAAISLVNSDSAHTGSNHTDSITFPGDFSYVDGGAARGDGSYSYGYDASASFDMLVVSVSREGSNDFSVKYDGVSMGLATGAETGSGASIYYLATSAQSGTIALDFTGTGNINGIGIGIAAIKSDNGDPIGLIDAASGTGTSITIDPTLAGSFTMFAIDTNGGAFSGLNTSPLSEIDSVTDIGSNGFGASYDEDVAAGNITYSYTNTADPRGIAAANFAVVPEPSAAALLGLGGLALLRHRRR
jgi:hypothetical protein